ncbi:phosphatase PAP2 family protein [Geodermatophilus sp. URMC 63]
MQLLTRRRPVAAAGPAAGRAAAPDCAAPGDRRAARAARRTGQHPGRRGRAAAPARRRAPGDRSAVAAAAGRPRCGAGRERGDRGRTAVSRHGGRRAHGALRATDRRGTRRAVRLGRRRGGGALSAATVAADRGLLWVALGAALTAAPGRWRRAGLAGLAATAATAAAGHLLKPAVRRKRPPRWTRIGARRAGRSPSTWSFPSGHAANGAAFTTAAALHAPAVGAVLAPVTALVAGSRLATARHHPSDVAGSVLLGGAIGATVGLGTRRRPAR